MRHSETIKPQVGFLAWRFEEGYNKDQDEMTEMFTWSRNVIWDYTKIEPQIYYDYDDPRLIIAVVCWPSLESHYQDLHKSDVFQEVLVELGGRVEVRSNYHANIGVDAFEAVTKGEWLMWNRWWVSDEHEAEFAKSSTGLAFDKGAGGADRPYASGWRITDEGWNERDPFDYYEKFGHSSKGPSAPHGITDEELSELNEMVQLVGLDQVRDGEPRSDGLSFTPSNIKLVKYKTTRRLKKMALRDGGEVEEGTDDDEESG